MSDNIILGTGTVKEDRIRGVYQVFESKPTRQQDIIRGNDVSLYVPAMSQVRLKWNTQDVSMKCYQDVSVLRLHDVLLEHCDDVSRGRNNDVPSVRLHDVSD